MCHAKFLHVFSGLITNETNFHGNTEIKLTTMPDVNPDILTTSEKTSTNLQDWSAIRRLSEQLTEATLAAMQQADARFPDKPLLDVPIFDCPNCHKSGPLYFTDSLNEIRQPTDLHSGLQRCGRSKSVALSGLDRGCKYCTVYFYQNPLKDYIWSRSSMHSSRTPKWQQRRSLHSRTSSLTPIDNEEEDILLTSGFYGGQKSVDRGKIRTIKRRSSSLIDMPAVSSQHTQTIFSSITTCNESSNLGSKKRSRHKSGSMYSKQASGLRFQLPAALQRTKSFRKPGLDFGLRKTLSVTNAIVRMPIESAAPYGKKMLDSSSNDVSKDLIIINTTSSPSLPKISQDVVTRNNRTTILHNEVFNISKNENAHSWPTSHTASREHEDALGGADNNQRVAMAEKQSSSDDYIERMPEIGISDGIPKQIEKTTLTKYGKRDVQLQTMADFEKEIKSSFNIPRILNEEDLTKEPDDGVDLESPNGIDDTSKQRSKDYWKEQFLTFFQPSDNKLAKKLFGTKVAINKERSRQRKQGKWIIHPASSFR